MRVQFWGTRGSLPAPCPAEQVRRKVVAAVEAARGKDLPTRDAVEAFVDTLPFAQRGCYGTNTACVQIGEQPGEHLLCDAGSGLRDFAHSLIKTGKIRETAQFHIFISHLHWDHIQGFPFFTPAFLAGNEVTFHTCHAETEAAIRQQMGAPSFPVGYEELGAKIRYVVHPVGEAFEVAGHTVKTIEHNHPGRAYGYRFEKEGRAVVYSTDCEHKDDAYDPDYRFLDFFREADLLIFDAQYSLADATFTKANWGHSSNVLGVELAARAGVKRLAIFHHEPTSSDEELDEFLHNTRMYRSIYHRESGAEEAGKPLLPEEILLAWDGLTIRV